MRREKAEIGRNEADRKGILTSRGTSQSSPAQCKRGMPFSPFVLPGVARVLGEAHSKDLLAVLLAEGLELPLGGLAGHLGDEHLSAVRGHAHRVRVASTVTAWA
jgi:hypothetical protein